MKREHRRSPGLACADSIRPFLKSMAHAEAFLLAGEPGREADWSFESYKITRAIGTLSESDQEGFAGLFSDSASYGEYVKLGAMHPTFGMRLVSERDTLSALFTFGQENHWWFRHGARTYVGHFDSVATEVRALVSRVAPDAEVR